MHYRTDNSIVRLSVARFSLPAVSPAVVPKLEAAGEPLHLDPAIPSFRKLPKDTWYSGMPMPIKVRIKHTGFQKVREAFVAVLLKQNKDGSDAVILESRSQNFEMEPQSRTCYTLSYTPLAPGRIDVYVSCFFLYDDRCRTTILQKVNIASPIVLKPWFVAPFLYCEVGNACALPLTNVRLTIPDGESKPVAARLLPKETETVFVEVGTPQKIVLMEWSVPFCLECRQNFLMPAHPERKEEDVEISVTVRDAPKIVPTLKPFKASLVLKNRTETELSGKLHVSMNESIIVHGKNQIAFQKIGKGEERICPVEFVALNEGDFLFPSLEIEINENQSKRVVKMEEGVLVVGCGE